MWLLVFRGSALMAYLICRGRQLRCAASDFWFINSCAVRPVRTIVIPQLHVFTPDWNPGGFEAQELRQHFPCQKGCAVQLGREIPSFVVDPGLPTYQQCLVTQARSPHDPHVPTLWSAS